MSEQSRVTMDQLRVGLYVYLDLRWFQHPFSFGHFKIKTEEQIRTIRGLGLETVRYDPAQSDMASEQTSAVQNPSPQPQPQQTSDVISRGLAAKKALIERIKVQREAAARIESAFVNTAKTVREIDKNIFSHPVETVRNATQLVNQIADSILSAQELAIHVMGDKVGGEDLYFHSLNVTMLSMMMARDLGLPQEVISVLGIGAIFHDIGHKEIPSKILLKNDPLTPAEHHLYEMHCQYGMELGQKLQFAPPVLSIIRDHHEFVDGTGYPRKLQGEQIGMLARIVAISNHYDKLCNPTNILNALTPHEALSTMFAKLRSKFDPKLLQVFIRCLGVYPPGTIVQLSNGVIGMVATVNTAKPMKPMVVIYDADIPKDEAILVDLEHETDLNIAKAIRPLQIPSEIYNYLSPRKRVSYYFDPSKQASEKVAP